MRKTILTLAAALALMTSLAISAVAQQAPATPAAAASLRASSVDVTIKEMSIAATSVTRAGPVTFTVTNTGTITHELVVIKTDLAEDQLPADATEDGKVSEEGSAGESGDLAPGATSVFTLTLGPGHYVLICNEPGHYAAGMHTTLTVASYVYVALKEMVIATDQTSIPAGPVTFNVTNAGTVQHEVVVIRTDLAADKLPADPDEAGKVSETGSAGESGDVDAGTSVEFTLTLAPGRYLLICNEPGHYAGGMHVTFTVTGTAPAPAATAQTSSVLLAVREMVIVADKTSVPAGTVSFEVVNIGTVTHEVVVIRTDLPSNGLPPNAAEAGKVSESGSAGESGDVEAGQFATFTLTLAPGAYVLICNEPGHYAAGMRLAFTVK